MESILLLGMMGAGKTTIGELLSTKLNFRFIDMDKTIEKKTGMTINEIFEKKGEKYFRILEKEQLAECLKNNNTVIAAGGGIVELEGNIDMLNKSNIIKIYLKTSPEELYKRLKNCTDDRPLLKKENDAGAKIKELCNRRNSLYESVSGIIVSTNGLKEEQIVDKIVKEL